MSAMNAFYAQSGGVTAVINASACGVIETARKHSDQIANVYAGRNGIIGGRGVVEPRRVPDGTDDHAAAVFIDAVVGVETAAPEEQSSDTRTVDHRIVCP